MCHIGATKSSYCSVGLVSLICGFWQKKKNSFSVGGTCIVGRELVVFYQKNISASVGMGSCCDRLDGGLMMDWCPGK